MPLFGGFLIFLSLVCVSNKANYINDWHFIAHMLGNRPNCVAVHCGSLEKHANVKLHTPLFL